MDVQAGSNSSRVSLCSCLVSLCIQRRCEGEYQCYNVLTECSKDHAGTQSGVYGHVRLNGKDHGYDSTKYGVRRLSSADRHVTDHHQFVGTTDNQSGFRGTKDQTNDRAGDHRTID